MIYGYIALFILTLFSGSFLFFNRKKIREDEEYKNKLKKIFKILVIVYMSLEFFLVFCPDSLANPFSNDDIKNLNFGLVSWLRWLSTVAFVTLPFAYYFENKKIITKIVCYFVLPVSIISCICFFTFYRSFEFIKIIQNGNELIGSMGIRGLGGFNWLGNPNVLNDILSSTIFRTIVFVIMYVIEIAASLFILISKKDELRFESKKEVGIIFAQLICTALTVIPIYCPQFILGTTTNIKMQSFNLVHILWILEFVIEIIVITITHKKKDYDTKYILAFTLTLALLLNYHQMFNLVNEIKASRLPLQLCNIASYLLLVVLIKKNEKLFHFTLIANVTGAILAIIMLGNNSGDGLLTSWNWHYITEHQNVLVTPIIMLTLGIFNPIKKSHYKDVFKYWLMYFCSVLVLGIILNAIYEVKGDPWFEANYFFMFDVTRADDFLPAVIVNPLFNTQLSLGPVHFKLIQPLIFIVFLGLFTGIFFLIVYLNRKLPEIDLNKKSEL